MIITNKLGLPKAFEEMAKDSKMLGKKFNRLTILERIAGTHKVHPKFVCKCECGNICIVSKPKLLRGHTKSCGCLQKERAYETKFKHGQTGSNLYKVWSEMKRRCQNPNSYAYKNYGGRGITVCDEWQNFIAFNRWANFSGYKQGLTIERINNELGYFPENCKWISIAKQNTNRRNTLYVNYRGEKVRLMDLAQSINEYKRLHSRVFRLGWDIERALSEPGKGGL